MPEFTLTALNNLGNTCYMNCAVQALFATEEFREYILEVKCNKRLHSSISQLFKEMIETGEKTDNDSISPNSFRDAFVEYKPEFNNSEQQDSQEFLRLLINGIHEEVNVAKHKKRPPDLAQPESHKESWIQYIEYMDDSFLVKLFVGQLSSTIKCTVCDHKSQCWESFWDISLSLPESEKGLSIKELIRAHTSDEVLADDAMPTCANCQTKTNSIKSLKIERLPIILMINLKRFANDGQKISKNVSVDRKLLLNAIPYELFACVSHSGVTAGSGHYHIYCRYTSGVWYHLDDHLINKIEDINDNHFSDAYILFYHLKNVTIKY